MKSNLNCTALVARTKVSPTGSERAVFMLPYASRLSASSIRKMYLTPDQVALVTGPNVMGAELKIEAPWLTSALTAVSGTVWRA